MAQTVKNLPAMQVTWVWSLGWEDPLKKEMATHSDVLDWIILWTEEPGGLQSMRLQRVRDDCATNTKYHFIWTWKWSLSVVPNSLWPHGLWLPGSPSMGFSRQEYRSGLPFPSSGDLPDPGIKPRSPVLQADALPSQPPEKPLVLFSH